MDSFVQTDDGRHGAGAFRYGFLHGQTTQLNQFDRIGKIERATAHQRRVLTQAVTRHHGRGCPTLLLPQAPQGDRGGQQRWLGAPGLVQIFNRTHPSPGQTGHNPAPGSPRRRSP